MEQIIYKPDPARGVINIGSDEENDIVVHDPRVMPFHMMLVCQDKPYQLIPLDPQAEISIRGVQVSGESAITISDLNEVEFAGHTLSIEENAGQLESISVSEAKQPSRADGLTVSGFADHPQNFSVPSIQQPEDMVSASDTVDDVIIVELSDTQRSIEVEQTAEYSLRVVNGGPIVASFEVMVTGVPDEWVKVQPAKVNLYEGGSAEVRISITPPRKPSSTAGAHPLQFSVTSPNHPGRRTVVRADLEIAPYYDFAVGNISPQRKTIPWRKKFGEVTLDVRNRGNSQGSFKTMAQDDADECQFQFVGANGLKQLGQVDYSIAPDEVQQIPIHISPVKRSLVRLTARQHPYRVSVSQVENESLSLLTVGTAISRPLIGILGVILAIILAAVTIGYLFTPRIDYFQADNSVIGVGESTTLRWKTFFLTRNLAISGIDDPITSNQGDKEIFPAHTVNGYTLSATTWLWNMLGLEPRTRSFTVLSVPNEPEITTFTLSDQDVIVGDQVLLRWSVQNAQKVALTVNGVEDIFEDPKDFNGERTLLIEMDTLVSIEATNALGSSVESEYIFARPPSIVIEQFELDKSSVYKGDQVTIIWKISGIGMADGGEVSIAPFESTLPLEGELTFFPEESMEFVLTVRNRQTKEVRILPVGVLDPAAPPEPPTINFFTAAPDTLEGGGNVELAWSVSGMFDYIDIKNGTETIAEGLSAQGFRTIGVNKSGTFVLTATNAGQSAGKELKITVDPALLKADLEVIDVYPTTGLEIGDSVNVAIRCDAPSADDPPPTGAVIVSDGASSCTITLPNTNCPLVFMTPGVKSITATYQGGPGYVQSKSEPYTPTFEVLGNQVTLSSSIRPENGPYYFSQKLSVRVRLEGTNPTRIPDGTIRVRRICDTTGQTVYHDACAADSWVYTLKPADDGYHEFTDILVNQMGGDFTLQIAFFDDSFYENTYDDVTIEIDDSIKSPVSITANTITSSPVNLGAPINYHVIVNDENDNSVYSTPRGNLAVSALNNDGVTSVPCNPALGPLSSIDGRSSYLDCVFTPSKAGTWTLKGVYTVNTAIDPWHEDTESNNIGTVAVNAGTQITLVNPPTNLPYLATTVVSGYVTRTDTNQKLTSGSLACDFLSTSDGTCSCAYNAASLNWDCDVKPTTTNTLPVQKTIKFSYTPGEYLNASQLDQAFQVVKANTVAVISAQPSASYTVGDTYSITVNGEHSQDGDNPTPASNDISIQLGYERCDPGLGMVDAANLPAYINTYDATSGTPRTITFTSAHVVGSDIRFCVRYDGSARYNPSPWVASDVFRVKSQPDFAAVNPSAVQIKASQNLDQLSSFTVTVNNGSNLNSANLKIINSANDTVLCPSSSSTFTCSLTGTNGNVFTYSTAASSLVSFTAYPKYIADGSNLEALGSNFTIASAYQVSMGSVSVSQGTGSLDSVVTTTYLWAYSNYETASNDKMTTDVSGSLSFDYFTSITDFTSYGLTASVEPVNLNGTALQLAPTSGTCTISTTGSISCPGVKVVDSTTNNIKIVLTPNDPTHFTGLLEAQSSTVHTIQNIIEDAGANTSYKVQITDGGCDGTKQQFNISGYAAGPGDPNNVLVPSDFHLVLSCEKDNDGNDTYDDIFIYDSSNSNFSTDMGWTGAIPNQFSFQITPKSNHPAAKACDYQVEKVKLIISLGYFQSNGSLIPFFPAKYTVHDYEVFAFDTGDIINDSNNRSDGIMFDDCGN